jgi:hypothetical protein
MALHAGAAWHLLQLALARVRFGELIGTDKCFAKEFGWRSCRQMKERRPSGWK